MNSHRVYVDAHVHVHDCFDLYDVLDAAARNFVTASSAGNVATCKYVLCLTETAMADKFADMSKQVSAGSAPADVEGAWSFKTGADDVSLVATHPDHDDIQIVAGRQIVTAERLEILALGTKRKWDDGLPAAEVIAAVTRDGAIPVLPWGFGKWLGRRQKVANKLIREFAGHSLFLGDNSGRPRLLPAPAEFSLASKMGSAVLRGSDPLPFATEYNKAGSFGFYIDEVRCHEGVWSGLRAALQQDDATPCDYGSLESPLRFVRNQVAMQFVTRVGDRGGAN